MIFFVGVLAITLTVAFIGFFVSKKMTWRELILQTVVQLLVAGASALIVYTANTHDEEVWNGVVTKKQQETTSCSHSYPCNCRTECSGSGKSKSCSTVCDTCYEHLWDYDWAVYFSTGDGLNINRVDRQGVNEPPRFTAVRIGEPAAIEHGYTNYVKAAPDSLFRRQGLVEKYQGTFPKYPNKIYDYYRIDRLVVVGTQLQVIGAREWNADLMKLNADIGNNWQADVAVVRVFNQPREWFYALEEKWLGGKKNDVIVVIEEDVDFTGMTKVGWVEVMAWAKDPIFKVRLRDAIIASAPEGDVEREKVIPIIRSTIMSSYERKPMADYAYLKSSIRPSVMEWIVTLIIGIAVAIGVSILLHREDVFGVRRGKWKRSW